MQHQQIHGSAYSSKPSANATNVNANTKKHVKPNGRIDILGPTVEQQFAMYDKIPNSSACSSFRDAMTGNWENTALSDAFFSTGNMEIVQNGLRNGVYAMSKGAYLIGPQDCDNLKMIMRSVFLQSAMNLAINISGQIAALNKVVVDMFVPKLYNEARSYIQYKRDASTMYKPIDRPIYSAENDKTLELKPWF
jgi:hypothetical protein